MTGSAAQFTYNAEITGAASATATVETSDDGKTVKEEKSAALTSGTGKIDLTGMQMPSMSALRPRLFLI